MKVKSMVTRLGDCVEHVYIVAYKEDVSVLVRALAAEGFRSTVVTPAYSDQELKCSGSIRCLLNHRNAWRRCADSRTMNMVVEADFVPVRGISRLPVPFDVAKREYSLGWLYACGPTLYDLDVNLVARGHAASTVAFLMGAPVASMLVHFAEEELKAHDPQQYVPWDTHLRVFLQSRGINSYLPFRNYGEHGGIPNPEHRGAGLAATHRADVLYGRLHFLPAYAQGSRMRFLKTRCCARARGLGRLLFGKYLQWHDVMRQKGWRRKAAMITYAVGRLVSPY